MSLRGPTPARVARETERRNAANEQSRLENESKFTAFQMQCDAGSDESCNSLAEWFVLMRGDHRAAAKLYTPLCLEKKHPQACLNLGNLVQEGKINVSQPQALAARVFALGCDGGNAAACAEGGTLFLKESGLFVRRGASDDALESSTTIAASTPASPERVSSALIKAASLLDRGCRAGDGVEHAKCCGLLGALMLHERAPSAALAAVGRSELRGAVDLMERACEREDPGACLNLAKLYTTGSATLGIVPDRTRVEQLRHRASLLHGLSPSAADALIASSSAASKTG